MASHSSNRSTIHKTHRGTPHAPKTQGHKGGRLLEDAQRVAKAPFSRLIRPTETAMPGQIKETTLPLCEGWGKKQLETPISVDSRSDSKIMAMSKRRRSPDRTKSGVDLRDMLNAKSHVSHVRQMMSLWNHMDALMSWVFPSRLRDLELKWFDKLFARLIENFHQLTESFETYNEIEECSKELVVASYKLGLTPGKRLWENLTLNPLTDLWDLMSQVLSVQSRAKKLRQVTSESRSITFTKANLERCNIPIPTALVIQLRMSNYDVKRILEDMGSSVEVMYYDLFKQLKLTLSDLKLTWAPFVGFNAQTHWPLGIVTIKAQVGSQELMIEFVVVDIHSHIMLSLVEIGCTEETLYGDK
ncbi:hypothetical protein Acr_00g0020340 [Actinidia rufa]|uniref:Uncharacterized protein n=1 Tax=Actinidia rufa TaxID=165716 RepID=A0A7J0DC03_9ERIC|nr:hypothetical protein Acr_00g0020340 [Actinidia rufa]